MQEMRIVFIREAHETCTLLIKLKKIVWGEEVKIIEVPTLSKLFNNPSLDPTMIILDFNNKSFEHTEISHLLRIKFPYARIVLYTEEPLEISEVQRIKNYGSFHFIIDSDLVGPDLAIKIKKISADHQIVRIMGETLKNPHPFSPAYGIMQMNENKSLEYLGYIISVYSIVKLAKLRDENLSKHDILLGAYLSAISEKMIYSGVQSDEPWVLNLGDLELFVHEYNDILLVLMYRYLRDVDRIHIIDKIKKLMDRIYRTMGDKLLYDSYVLPSDGEAVDQEIKNLNLEANLSKLEYRVPNFVFINPPDNLLDSVGDFPVDIQFSIVPSFSIFEKMIKSEPVDVVFIKTNATYYRDLVDKLEYYYRLYPSLRVILYLIDTVGVDFTELFESKVIDYLVLSAQSTSSWLSIIDMVSSELITSQLYDLDIPRTYLLKSMEKYMTAAMMEKGKLYIPIDGIELASIYIFSQKEMQFYYEWVERDTTLSLLFENIFQFIDSFRALSFDLSENDDYILFEFGSYTLLFFKRFAFDYVVIVKNADAARYDEGVKYLKQKADTLTEIIFRGMINKDPETYFELSGELDSIYLDLLSLNF